MKTAITLMFTVLLLTLASCSAKNNEQESAPLFKVPEKLLENQTEKEEKSEERILPVFEEKPLAECALLTKEEGKEWCGLEYEESEETSVSCAQVFRNKTALPVGIELQIWKKDSIADAKEKFEMDLAKLNGKLVDKKLPLQFKVEDQVKEITEFVNKKNVVKITSLPKNSCANINKVVSTLIKRT